MVHLKKAQGPNISMIGPDVIKCYQMTDTVHSVCDLKPLCFSNISSLIIINHNNHQIDKYKFKRKYKVLVQNVFVEKYSMCLIDEVDKIGDLKGHP